MTFLTSNWKHALLCGATLLCATSAHAFLPGDADTIFNAYNNAFYVSNGGNAYYADDTTRPNHVGFWSLAEEIEMAEDAYGRTNSSGVRDMITALCNGFTAANGTDWTYNKYNDDIQWACIAFARAYQITGNTSFRTVAKNNWDAMYARGYDGALYGGIWWTTDKGSKNACSNGPAIIGAYLLSQILNDSSYVTKAQNIYTWERAALFDNNSGGVYDNMDSTGKVTQWVISYNLGTFIGAANYLSKTVSGTQQSNYLSDAQKAANYAKNTLCNNGGLLPDSGLNGDGGGFNGILLRWVVRYMNDQGKQSDYLPWLQLNANAAWSKRRTSDNLAFCNWDQATPSGTLASYDCVNSVIALQLIPAPTNHVILNKQTGQAVDNNNTTQLGTGVVQWQPTSGSKAQQWTFTQNSDGTWKITNALSGYVLDNPNSSGTNGTQMDQWTSNGGANQKWKLIPLADGYYEIQNQASNGVLDGSSSTTNGYKLIQWQWNGGDQQRWTVQ